MSEKEKNVVSVLAKAVDTLSDSKKEYLLGYAEGVIAAAEAKEKN
mgnify:CR=1 FL=1